MYEYSYEETLKYSSILKSTYEVLIHHKNSGLWPVQFRWDLGTKLNLDEDKLLQRYEFKLIKEGWIIQIRAGELIRPSEKLINRYLNR